MSEWFLAIGGILLTAAVITFLVFQWAGIPSVVRVAIPAVAAGVSSWLAAGGRKAGNRPLTTEASLRDAVKNSLLRAHENGLTSVAFPAIGTGVAGFPMALCADVMLAEITRFLDAHETTVAEVRIVLFDARGAAVFQKAWKALPG